MLAFWAGAMTGCQTGAPNGPRVSDTVPQLNADAAAAAGLGAEEINNARSLYVAKCARCHKFYDPAQYREAEWRSWMSKMGRKARLRPEQQELLSRYLDAYRAGRITGAGNAEPKL